MLFFLCVVLPPLAVLLTGRMGSFFLSLVLTLLGWLPGLLLIAPASAQTKAPPDTIYLGAIVTMDGSPATIELPASMIMVVAEAPEGVKGDSANNVYKSAVMETGLVVGVPLFINPGEKICVKTEDGSYLGRAN